MSNVCMLLWVGSVNMNMQTLNKTTSPSQEADATSLKLVVRCGEQGVIVLQRVDRVLQFVLVEIQPLSVTTFQPVSSTPQVPQTISLARLLCMTHDFTTMNAIRCQGYKPCVGFFLRGRRRHFVKFNPKDLTKFYTHDPHTKCTT